MGQHIPVPAETLRRLSESAARAVIDSRLEGRKSTARALQRDVATAMEASVEGDGEFVSVPGGVVSSLAAFGHKTESSSEYVDGATVMLEQYDVW